MNTVYNIVVFSYPVQSHIFDVCDIYVFYVIVVKTSLYMYTNVAQPFYIVESRITNYALI